MKTKEVVARVYVYVSLARLKDSAAFYKLTGLSLDHCKQREIDTNTVKSSTRTSYASTMGLSLEEFDQPLPDFLSTLKLKLKAHHGN